MCWSLLDSGHVATAAFRARFRCLQPAGRIFVSDERQSLVSKQIQRPEGYTSKRINVCIHQYKGRLFPEAIFLPEQTSPDTFETEAMRARSESTLALLNSTILTLLITTSHNTVLVVHSPQDATDIRKAANFWLPSTIVAVPAMEEELRERVAGLVVAWTSLSDDQFTVCQEPVMRGLLPYPLPPLNSQTDDQKLLSTIFFRVDLQMPIHRISDLRPAAELLANERDDDDGIEFELHRLTKREAKSIRAHDIGAMIPVRKLFGLTNR